MADAKYGDGGGTYSSAKSCGGVAELKGAKGSKGDKDSVDASTDALRATIRKFTEDWLDFSNTDMMELFEWEVQHWHQFDPDEDEHSLVHSELHAQYAALFEAKLEAYITATEGLSVEDFYQRVRAEMESADGKGRQGKEGSGGNLGAQLLGVVSKAMDFGEWAASMRKCVADQRALEDVD